MKPVKIIIALIVSINLVACHTIKVNADGSERSYLEGDRGAVIDCATKFSKPDLVLRSSANAFWKNNNLPKGTLDFVCRDGKAYLPQDCQGNSLNRQQILAYWNKYQLPKGLVHFDCSSGTPKVPTDEVKFWQDLERQTPTCRGGKPCV